MKKIIAIFAVLLLCGCEPESQTRIQTEDGTTLYVREFVYKGHRYIEFGRMKEAYDNYTGYVHDPDCPCHNEEEK